MEQVLGGRMEIPGVNTTPYPSSSAPLKNAVDRALPPAPASKVTGDAAGYSSSKYFWIKNAFEIIFN